MQTFNLLEGVEADDCNDAAVEAELYKDSMIIRLSFEEGYISGGQASIFFKSLKDLKKFSANLQNAIRDIEDAN